MNYIGSKYSLLNFIDDIVSDYTHGHDKKIVLCDAFAGTGVVGRYFRNKGHKIISNDIQYYSFVVNKFLIQGRVKSFNKLDYLNALNGVDGFIYNNYCFGSGSNRLYFTDSNGRKCDAIRQEIERLFIEKKISEDEYYSYLAMLIEAIDKVANTASVYGAFLKKIKKSAEKELTLVAPEACDGSSGIVYNEDINKLINNISGDVLYLDPPYNARQYASNYHILETVAKYDNPEIFGKTGLRDYANQKSKYCSKTSVEHEFEEIIKNAKFKLIILSYNNEGLMPLSVIKSIMSKYGEYSLVEKEYRRFKADKTGNRNHKANSTKEYLHILKKK